METWYRIYKKKNILFNYSALFGFHYTVCLLLNGGGRVDHFDVLIAKIHQVLRKWEAKIIGPTHYEMDYISFLMSYSYDVQQKSAQETSPSHTLSVLPQIGAVPAAGRPGWPQVWAPAYRPARLL